MMATRSGRTSTSRPRALARAAGAGAAAGLVGAAAMIVTEKVEQAITRRPDSYVPGRALLTLLGRRPGEQAKPAVANQLMHFGTGAVLGALRGVWAVTGIRGPYAHLWHTGVRLAFDQTVENTTGVGAPPADWPARETAVDVAHKAVFAVVTGSLLDRTLRPDLRSERGRTSH
jgi:hypothetical protein